MTYIRLYVDHPKIGCGFRPFLVLKTGRVWAHLLATETAETIKIPVADLKWAKPLPLKSGRLARRLKLVDRDFNPGPRLTEPVREAIALLKSA